MKQERDQAREKIDLAVHAARLYYLCGEKQEQIAQKLNISRPQVSRLLQLARDEGIVQFHISNPLQVKSQLENLFCQTFNLKHAVIVNVSSADSERVKEKLARVAADYLDDIIGDNQIIGLPWGSTLDYTARFLKERHLKGVSVVQLKGGVCRVSGHYDTYSPVFTFARKLNGTPYLLPVPGIVESPTVKKVLLQDKKIKEILSLGEAAEIAVFSIGVPHEDSVLVRAGYFTPREMARLRARGAVGDICSRYFDINGRLFDPSLNARTIGIELEKLREKKYSVAIAGGIERAGGILGALRGGYINVLITDEETAREVLRLGEIHPEK